MARVDQLIEEADDYLKGDFLKKVEKPKPGTIGFYCGATVNLSNRRNAHEKKGYKGTMFFVSTNDMKNDEEELIKRVKSHIQDGRRRKRNLMLYNKSESSQKQENDQGLVYLIAGVKENKSK